MGLFNLHKEKLLYAFYDNPEGVRHDLRVLTDALCYMHRWFQRNIPPERFTPVCCGGRIQPRGRGQMCGCTTQLVSKEIYDDFIYPFDCEVLSLYPDGGMYHLCGSHTQHISTWSQCKQLKAFQLNDRATDDLEYYVTGLREAQILYAKSYRENHLQKKPVALTGGNCLIYCPNRLETRRRKKPNLSFYRKLHLPEESSLPHRQNRSLFLLYSAL